MPRRSLLEYLAQYPQRGSDVAIAQRRGYRMVRWTYAQIAHAASKFALELESLRIAKGDRVLLWGDNSAEWVIAFLGCLLRGALVVPMDRIASPEFARRVALQVDPKLLVVSRHVPQLDSAAPILLLEDLPQILAARPSAPFSPAPLERSDPVEIVFTSGTTAEPKGVVISHGNILANLEPLEQESRKYMRYERFFHPIRFLNLLPLSHVFGQLLGIFIPQLIGGTVIFLDSIGPAEVARAIRRERVSLLVAVPRLIESLRDKIERDEQSSGRLDRLQKNLAAAANQKYWSRLWRFRRIHRQFGWKFWAVISGGAALPAEVETFWTRLGYAVIQGYGLTETTSLVSLNHPFRLGQGSIGKAMPGLELQLDVNGEILVRGENVAAGYWQGRQLAPVAALDGWFHTGDLGERDAQGNLYFRGRLKNVIVTPAGMNIYPEDLEAVLRQDAAVRDCVVLGLEQDGNAEPCAVLILRDPAADPLSILDRANSSLASYQRMRHCLLWPGQDFPRTPTQKPRLVEIRAFVQSNLPQKVAAAAAQKNSGLAASAPASAANATDPNFSAILRTAGLESDLGLTSIDRVELLSALEERYQVDLSEAQFSNATTAADLERLVHGSIERAPKYDYPRWPQLWPFTWIRIAVYYLLTWPATYLLAAPRIKGREHFRGVRGPVLVISNHITRDDVGYVLAGLPMRLRHRLAVAMEGEVLRAMQHPPANRNLFARGIERLSYFLVVALFNVFPLPQLSGFRESFAFAGESVDRGYNLLVFPEGRRTPDGKMAPFRAGIGLLATRLDLPVIPMRIDGLFDLKQAKRKTARPGHVRVTIGEPVKFPRDTAPALIAAELERRVIALDPSLG